MVPPQAPPPGGNYFPPMFPPPPPPRRSRKGKMILGTVAAAVAVAGAGTVGYTLSENNSTASDSASPSSTSWSTTPAPVASAISVTASDFSLETLTEEKECFGSAGCVVTISIQPTFLGSPAALMNRSFKVLYRVDGGESPILEKFTMTGTRATIDSGIVVATDSSDAEITATVTQVIETTDET